MRFGLECDLPELTEDWKELAALCVSDMKRIYTVFQKKCRHIS